MKRRLCLSKSLIKLRTPSCEIVLEKSKEMTFNYIVYICQVLFIQKSFFFLANFMPGKGGVNCGEKSR
jgi:hypothetical protein